MSAVEVTISGTLFDKLNRTTQQVVLIGEATLTGVGVGGGPVIPPQQPTPPDPNAPQPSHPIMLPGMPGWGVPPGAHPSHPIALPGDPWWPKPPVQPPQPPEVVKPPPPEGGWGWVPPYGWAYFPSPSDPTPK
jgi:hypothetical protein